MQTTETAEAPAFVPPPSSWFETEPTNSSNPITESHAIQHPMAPIVPQESIPMHIQPPPSLVDGPGAIVATSVSHPKYFAPPETVGHTQPSPSWKEISSQVLPAAARELLSSSCRRIYYTARLSYAKGRWQRKYSDLGNNSGGIYQSNNSPLLNDGKLPHFSSLSWIDRQLVKEWRTYLPNNDTSEESGEEQTIIAVDNDEDSDFERARALVPNPLPRPTWRKTDVCHACKQTFGPTRLRHHCRMCGYSFCQSHSSSTHPLPQFEYDPEVPERVCDNCKRVLTEQNLAERVAWRLARCRDYTDGNLTPYFEMGLDSASEIAMRITRAAIIMAKAIPLGAQATVAVETVDVLRKHGLNGIYGIMLRQEFLAAADLLQRALGINKASWPLSVHELSAAIFYALAQHRAMRGLYPDREEVIHTLRSSSQRSHMMQNKLMTSNTSHQGFNVRTTVPAVIDNFAESALSFHNNPILDHTDTYNPEVSAMEQLNETFESGGHDPRNLDHLQSPTNHPGFEPVCDHIPDAVIASLIFYAPIALNFIYAEKEVDMQLLAAQQGWRLVYAFLEQDRDSENITDRPASALFLHQEHKVACLSIRGTATINDVVTDIRQVPVPFPDQDVGGDNDDEWTDVFRGQGLALHGMASAAVNLFREHVDSIVYFVQQGYRIRVTGHSLGGGVAAMVGVLLVRHLERHENLSMGKKLGNIGGPDENSPIRVYAYGTPSCMDASLASSVEGFVTTVVLHDDVIPRLTPTSCRALLKHLLYIRETWVKKHIEQDLRAVSERARAAWAPRLRHNFTLAAATSSASIKKYCKKQYEKGKETLFSTKLGELPDREKDETTEKKDDYSDTGSTNSHGDWGERFFVSSASPSVSQSLNASLVDSDVSSGPQNAENAVETDKHTILSFLGGFDDKVVGTVIDGDEFFETDEKLMESDDDEVGTVTTELFGDPHSPENEHSGVGDSWSIASEQMQGAEDIKEKMNEDSGTNAVVIDETPLPRMFVPGKIAHVYSHYGVYKAAYVPKAFRELRRISMAGNMLSNHGTKGYFEALVEVQTARSAPERPPRWTAFNEDDTCCCCANRFTWASTSDSEAQEARDKHNCRSCGGLVCDPCAKNRIPIPSIGLTVPVRVCDRCYHDMGGHSVASSSMTSSFLAVEEEEHHSPDDGSTPETLSLERPERRRERRSVVVDELASQIWSSALVPPSGRDEYR